MIECWYGWSCVWYIIYIIYCAYMFYYDEKKRNNKNVRTCTRTTNGLWRTDFRLYRSRYNRVVFRRYHCLYLYGCKSNHGWLSSQRTHYAIVINILININYATWYHWTLVVTFNRSRKIFVMGRCFR